jgi:hypothetical protein
MNVYHIYRFASPPDPDDAARPTGIKDELGREICEGDIVECYDALWEVQRYGRECGIVNPENDDIYVRSFKDILRRSRVVGSIYEEPLAE